MSKMTLRYAVVVAMLVCVGVAKWKESQAPSLLVPGFYPPAVPLVVVNPYLRLVVGSCMRICRDGDLIISISI